jgi:hypothetical protein
VLIVLSLFDALDSPLLSLVSVLSDGGSEDEPVVLEVEFGFDRARVWLLSRRRLGASLIFGWV